MRRYVASAFNNEPYLAVHVRPQKDECLKLWVQNPDGRLPGNDLPAKCSNLGLWYNMVHQTKDVLDRHKLKHVFAACHPDIQPAVTSIYAAAGVKVQFYDPKAAARGLGHGDAAGGGEEAVVSLAMFVEQAVSEQAAAFLGTYSSSITGAIIQARTAQGLEHTSGVFLGS